MISKMDKRVAGVVAVLGLAFASSRPALAQEADSNSWFDEAPAEAPPPPLDQNLGPSAPPPGQAPLQPGPSAAPTQPGPQAPGPEDNVPETDPRALTEFRSNLDPYGSWVEDEKYGTVWVPNRDAVGDDFAPYVSAGHWALTEDGDWTWQSDYPFGGVVFHYGRWVWLPGTGWAWVAGRRYANAWVNWRVSTDDYGYIGWAPMAPAWGWYGGSAISLWWYPPTAYVFCPNNYAFSYHVHSYIVHDQYVIHDVAAHTRNYSSGGGGHLAASPRVLPANSAAPRGPSLQSARIPASATPMSRVSSRSAFAGGRAAPASAYGVAGSRSLSSNGSRPISGSSYQSPTAYRAQTYANPGAYRSSTYANPSAYRSPTYANPSSYARPRSPYSAPLNDSYRAPRAAPRYSSPSAPARYSAPASHYSAPAAHYSAPTRYSAPAVHYSAPSFHSAPSSAPSHSFHSPSRR